MYDTNCRAIDSLTTTGNPCDSGMFGCTPAPITFNRWRYNANGLWFSCRTDSRAGSCGGDSISVCVSLHHRIHLATMTKSLYLNPAICRANPLVQCRNDGNRLASFEPEEVGLDLTEEEFSEEAAPEAA